MSLFKQTIQRKKLITAVNCKIGGCSLNKQYRVAPVAIRIDKHISIEIEDYEYLTKRFKGTIYFEGFNLGEFHSDNRWLIVEEDIPERVIKILNVWADANATENYEEVFEEFQQLKRTYLQELAERIYE